MRSVSKIPVKAGGYRSAVDLSRKFKLSLDNSPYMCSDQQIEKLKGHVLIFSEELRSLIQSFELLSLAAQDQELLGKISGTKRARGFSVNRWSLVQECIIGITKLTYDQGSQNSTAGNLIERIVDPQAAGLRQKLKTVFAVPIRLGLVPGRPPTETDLAFRQEIERKDVEELKQAFEQDMSELEREWQWFRGHRDQFKNLRDRRLAHVDVAKAGQTYELKQALGPEWMVVKEAIQRLIHIAELLLTILQKRDESFDQFVELSRQDAPYFWEIDS